MAAPVPRSLRRRSADAFLRITAPLRALPDFLVIGAMKGGTTSLHRYLLRHPWIAPSRIKEVHFFDNHFHHGLNWYRSNFPLRRGLARRGIKRITGEATPYYMFHPLAPARVQAVVPSARIVVLLREPISRALSHFQHEVRQGRETLSFAEAVLREPERLRGEAERMLNDPLYESHAHQHYSYISRGFYAEQLRLWQQHFAPAQMLVLRSDALYRDPEQCVAQVLSFLSLPPMTESLREEGVYNRGGYDTSMEPETRAYLEEVYTPHNAALLEMTGINFREPL